MLDDSFISFRYAENFADGNGLVFNIGERVEGYTTFLWVILLAFAYKLGLSTIAVAIGLGYVFSISTLVLLAYTDRFIKNLPRTVPLIATLIAGSCGIFTPWARSGMELPLFMFLMLLSVLLYLRIQTFSKPKKNLLFVGIVCTLTALTRPEGVLLFLLLSLAELYRSRKRLNAGILYQLTPFILLYIPYFIWRYIYYGYLFPNTYYTKVGSSIEQFFRGIEYTSHFMEITFFFFICIGALIIFLLRHEKKSSMTLPLIVIGVWTLYVITVGGDPMPAFRFFAPIIPFLSLTAALGICLWTRKLPSYGRGITVTITILIVLLNVYFMYNSVAIAEFIARDKTIPYGPEVGLWIREHSQLDTIIAVNAAGTVPYYSDLYTIDMLGLNNEHIGHRDTPSLGVGWAGHEKGDGDYVFAQNPDYIIFGGVFGSYEPIFRSDFELDSVPQFHKLYSASEYPLSDGRSFIIYEKNTFKPST